MIPKLYLSSLRNIAVKQIKSCDFTSQLKNIKYNFSNLNKQTNSQSQLRGHGRKNDRIEQTQQSSTTNLNDIIFPYPFQFTLQSENYKYYDPRFTQYPLKKNLQSGQKQHLIHVLQNFQNYLNSGLPQSISAIKSVKGCSPQVLKHYIHPSLSSKLPNFLQVNKEAQLMIKFNIDKDTITKTQGYMQIQAKNIQQASNINYLNPKYLHQYTFERQKQLLLISQIKKKTKKSQQEILKNDVQQMLDQKSQKKQVRQFFDQVQKSKTNDSQRAMNILMSKLKGLTSKKVQKKREQQIYVTSQLIKGKVQCQVYYQNKIICQEQTQLYSKWMYVVEKNQPQSIRKSRKRILYDFQFWNRGSFFQVKNWIQNISL